MEPGIWWTWAFNCNRVHSGSFITGSSTRGLQEAGQGYRPLSAPPWTIFAWKKLITQQRGLARTLPTRATSSSWGSTAISSVPWRAQAAQQGPPPSATGGQRRKVGQPTSHPLFLLPWQEVQRAGRSEPAGCLPHTSPGSRAGPPNFHSLLLHDPSCSFWWEQMQRAQTAPQCCS